MTNTEMFFFNVHFFPTFIFLCYLHVFNLVRKNSMFFVFFYNELLIPQKLKAWTFFNLVSRIIHFLVFAFNKSKFFEISGMQREARRGGIRTVKLRLHPRRKKIEVVM